MSSICIWEAIKWTCCIREWKMIVSGDEDGHVIVRDVDMKEIFPVTCVSSVACSLHLIRKQSPLRRMIMAH